MTEFLHKIVEDRERRNQPILGLSSSEIYARIERDMIIRMRQNYINYIQQDMQRAMEGMVSTQ